MPALQHLALRDKVTPDIWNNQVDTINEALANSQSGVAASVGAGTILSQALLKATGGTTQVSLADYSARTLYPEDFGAVGDGVTDDAPAFQRAHDALMTQYGPYLLGGRISCRSARYAWKSPVVVTGNVAFLGTGATDGPELISGTTFVVTGTGFIPFMATGTTTRGFHFQGISWEHAQNYGAAPFVPVDYPPAMVIANTFGGFVIDDVSFKGATRGILALGCGHFEIRKVIGQAFKYLVSVDGCADTPKIDYLRQWTYVTNSLAIGAYCQANTTVLEVARCDDIDLGTVFGFSVLAAVRGVMGHRVALAPSAPVASGAAVVQLADTSGLCAGMTVMGTGIAPGTTISAVGDGAHITLSTPTVAALGTVSPLVFGCYGPVLIPRTSGSAPLAAGSTSIPLASTAGIYVGQNVVAEFLPLSAIVTSVGAASITVSQPTTLAAPVGSSIILGSGFPTAFATTTAAATSSTTLQVGITAGTIVPNMRLVTSAQGGTSLARVLAVTGSTITLDTPQTLASGVPVIFQVPPAGNTGGGCPQFDALAISTDRGRAALWLDGVFGYGTNNYLEIGNLFAGGEDSSISTGGGTPLDLAYGAIVNSDRGFIVRATKFNIQQMPTSAIRVGGGSAGHVQLTTGSTQGMNINAGTWGVRPLFNIEGSATGFTTYPNTVTIDDLLAGSSNGGPIFSVPAGVAAYGFCHRYLPDGSGNAMFGVCSGSFTDATAGDRTQNVGGTWKLTNLAGNTPYLAVSQTTITASLPTSIASGSLQAWNGAVGQVYGKDKLNSVAFSGMPALVNGALTYTQGDFMSFTAFNNPAGAGFGFYLTDGTTVLNQIFAVTNTEILADLPFMTGPNNRFTYAGLPNPANYPTGLAWCVNARVGSQGAGAGTGSWVQVSGGSWVMLDGAPIQT